MKLTKINIAKVTVPRGKTETIEFDDDVPGFGLRIRVGGSQTWIFQYRQGSKQRRISLGRQRPSPHRMPASARPNFTRA
jgi:hypothetical protein